MNNDDVRMSDILNNINADSKEKAYQTKFASIQRRYANDKVKTAIFSMAVDYINDMTILKKTAPMEKVAKLTVAEKLTEQMFSELKKEAAATQNYMKEVEGYEKLGSLLSTLFEQQGISADMIAKINNVQDAVKLGQAGGKLLANYLKSLEQ